mmetsp:Transcript_23801/g.36156  ORF Transcript_23801/g.36156 Transcript_23801/m.36156 type:complete len:114 (+) Transcript_23801:69-410(+)
MDVWKTWYLACRLFGSICERGEVDNPLGPWDVTPQVLGTRWLLYYDSRNDQQILKHDEDLQIRLSDSLETIPSYVTPATLYYNEINHGQRIQEHHQTGRTWADYYNKLPAFDQ